MEQDVLAYSTEQDALAYSTGERVSVGVSAVLGYGLDFYNILVVSFLMGAIRHDLNITLTEAGVITTVTLVGSRNFLRRGHSLGIFVEFRVSPRSTRHYRHRTGRRMGGRDGSVQRGLAGKTARTWQRYRASRHQWRHRCRFGRRCMGVDQLELFMGVEDCLAHRRRTDLPHDLCPFRDARVAALARL